MDRQSGRHQLRFTWRQRQRRLERGAQVQPGSTTAGADAEYVELQMYASGQNQIQTHPLIVYNATGNPTETTAAIKLWSASDFRT